MGLRYGRRSEVNYKESEFLYKFFLEPNVSFRNKGDLGKNFIVHSIPYSNSNSGFREELYFQTSDSG
jgi:hypothetical protein